ncbi:MAG TPA: DegT/DnrJ/EryC1/StrS family aminotransferase [Salinimicrobium sp.]|nr:DegT/DnrJ/EryC1/StrS family aminotransferase [Salinimicrobium sp.]
MIPVTKPFLPPKAEYEQYLSKIWKSQWLTNMGPLANDLELKLKEHLKVTHLLFVTNGTVALQMAIKALGLKGEIITTPFSFIATTSSIVWEGCKPVFVDIDKDSLNIDPTKIEAAITEKTTAILATHVYGNPCDVEAIEKIAKKHDLKVIYDAAHAFGVELKGKSIFEYGDISICSLHATKLYHSGEGGLLMTKNSDLLKKLAYIRNFGFDGPEAFAELGINGKNSEFHAAMGLVNLNYIQQIHEKRKALTERYVQKLKNVRGFIPKWHPGASQNYAYFPFVFESETLAMDCLAALKSKEIFARRYFYPSLAKVLPYLEPKAMPVTENIAKRILCLPLYFDLSLEEVDMICRLILRTQNN